MAIFSSYVKVVELYSWLVVWNVVYLLYVSIY